jgi:hypothetical protein
MSNQSFFANNSSGFSFPDRSTPTEPNSPIEPTRPNEPTRPTEPNVPDEPTRPTEPDSYPDPGETFDEALDLGMFSNDGDGNGSANIESTTGVGNSNPIDLYQFSIDQTDDFSATLDGLDADVDLYMFDGDGEMIGASENFDSAAEFLEGSLAGGTYFLGVSSFDGIDTGYELNISFEDSAFSSVEANLSSDSMLMSQELSFM